MFALCQQPDINSPNSDKRVAVEAGGCVRPQGVETPGKVSGKNDAENGKSDINESAHATSFRGHFPSPSGTGSRRSHLKPNPVSAGEQ